MGQNFVVAGSPDQMFLLPPDAREWLPPGHLAWAVLEQAGQLDVSSFLARYRADGQGRPAYHPAVTVALVMYCYCKGIRSSRAVEMATFDDVGARVITGNLHPDHATNAWFVTRHADAVKGLLVASLAACAREGLVSVEVVAGDGTKVKASASMAANVTAEQLDLDIAELEAVLAAEVDEWLAQARAEDAAEDALFSGGDGGPVRAGGPGLPLLLAARRVACPLGRRGHLRELLIDPAGPLPGLGELGGLGKGLPMLSRGVSMADGGEDGGLAVLQVMEAMLEAGSQGAGIGFPEIPGGQADAGAWSAVERDAHRGFAQ